MKGTIRVVQLIGTEPYMGSLVLQGGYWTADIEPEDINTRLQVTLQLVAKERFERGSGLRELKALWDALSEEKRSVIRSIFSEATR